MADRGDLPLAARALHVAAPWERWTGRIIPLDEHDRALLMHGIEPSRPEQPYWFTIGGAIEDGETAREAAVRELREETGIVVDPARLGEAVVCETVEFSYGGRHIVQHQEIFTCRLGSDVDVTLAGLGTVEANTIDGCAWVDLATLRALGQQIEGADVASYVESCQQALAAAHPSTASA